uniref:Negative elongation factor B n=1 Tax=Strigamia maritima TaxID=126957 RepID=T1J7M6_STRMM
MAGLEEVGIAGPEYLREALTNCSDPLTAIEDFQVENGILLPSLRPMLPLLDLHGVQRLDFHQSVLEQLRERLLKQIHELGQTQGKDTQKKLKDLLQKTFPIIRVRCMRPVVLAVLKHLSHVEDKYLKELVTDRELYSECDTEVKRQVWQDNQALFGDEVSPLLSQYIKEKENLLFNHENLSNQFFNLSPKLRRQGEVVQKLSHMIGRNIKLYDMVLQFLRTLFHRTRNVHYCTLRAELLMALHDLEIQEITNVDPCHKFTWCLDACIRERNVDSKRARELQGFLDNPKRGQEQVLGDLSMTLCDPYAINFLATSALRILNVIIHNETLPRENPVLIQLLRMLALGLQAREMIDSQVFKEPKLDSQLITKFLPALMSLVVDDQARAVNAKLPPDDRQSALTTIEHSGPPPDTYLAYIQESSVASILAMYYNLQAARIKDRQGLMRVLGTIANCNSERAFEDHFLHTLVALMVTLADEFGAEDFCTVVFDEFFFTAITRENVLRHLLKLLWYIYPKMPPNRLELLMKALQPASQHAETVHILYQLVSEKIKIHQSGPAPLVNLKEISSPLINVPTPAPL